MDITKELSGIQLDSAATLPLYLQIAEYIGEKIKNYFLPAQTKLPPERTLAKLLGVSRTTAINAYRHLEEQGLVQTRIGSGTYVTSTTESNVKTTSPIAWEQLFIPPLKNPLSSILRTLVSPATEDTISLAVGMPGPSLYPLDAFQSIFRKHAKKLNNLNFAHIPTEGYDPFRQALAQRQTKKGMPAQAEEIMVLSGCQQGLYLIAKTFIEPGDYIVVESPTYIGAIQAFQASGARILSLPRGENLPLELLEDYIIRYRPKFFYTIPTFQNPTGYVLSLSQRKALLELAAQHRLAIVEDDTYSELYFDQQPPPSLKSLDHYGGVLYLNTFSKILFPGLRTGWLMAPPVVINRLAQEKQYMDLHSNNLTQWLIHLFLEEELLDSHLAIVRQEYKKRRDALASSIQRFCGNNLAFTLPQGGFYLWCQINNSTITSSSLLHESSKEGVTFVPGEAFYTNQWGSREIRLCFAGQEESQLLQGAKRMAKVLNQASLIPDRKSVV